MMSVRRNDGETICKPDTWSDKLDEGRGMVNSSPLSEKGLGISQLLLGLIDFIRFTVLQYSECECGRLMEIVTGWALPIMKVCM